MIVTVPKADEATSQVERLSFHGRGGDLFRLLIKNLLLTIVTIGIYSFWAKTDFRRYMHSQLELQGDRFAYHGTARELLIGRLKALAYILLPLFVLRMVAMLANNLGLRIALYAVIILLPFAILPLAITGSLRYRLGRTSWHGIRFSFRGRARDLYQVFVPNALLTLVTFGFYLPVAWVRMANFLASNVYFGNTPLEFEGKAAAIYGEYLAGIFLSYATLGIYGFWLQAHLERFFWQNTSFGGTRFRSTQTGGGLMRLRLVNFFSSVFTLGFASAWIQVRTARYRAEHLEIVGKLDLRSVKQEIQKAGALGDMVVDGSDMDFFLGV
ncbi:MAG TPA: YjgN family protein [Oscillatoriaceae cyanobacterium]